MSCLEDQIFKYLQVLFVGWLIFSIKKAPFFHLRIKKIFIFIFTD